MARRFSGWLPTRFGNTLHCWCRLLVDGCFFRIAADTAGVAADVIGAIGICWRSAMTRWTDRKVLSATRRSRQASRWLATLVRIGGPCLFGRPCRGCCAFALLTSRKLRRRERERRGLGRRRRDRRRGALLCRHFGRFPLGSLWICGRRQSATTLLRCGMERGMRLYRRRMVKLGRHYIFVIVIAIINAAFVIGISCRSSWRTVVDIVVVVLAVSKLNSCGLLFGGGGWWSRGFLLESARCVVAAWFVLGVVLFILL